MSRPTGTAPKGPVSLPPQGEQIRSLAQELGWEIDQRHDYLVIKSPTDNKRISIPYRADHPDWKIKVETQIRNSGILDAYSEYDRARQSADLENFQAANSAALTTQDSLPAAAELASPAGELTCDVCGRGFPRKPALGSHRRKAHGIKGTSDSSLQRRRSGGNTATATGAAFSAEPPASPDLSEESTPVSTISAPAIPAQKASTAAVQPIPSDLSDVEAALKIVLEEVRATVSRAMDNTPAPEVVQEAADLRIQAASLEKAVEESKATITRLTADLDLVNLELQGLRQFKADTVKMLDGRTSPVQMFMEVSKMAGLS